MTPEIRRIFEQVGQVVSPVYLVGGSVRDALLDKTPSDYDFSTPLTPDEIEMNIRKFGLRPFTTGKRFGTIGFKVDKLLIEITTFRLESYSQGSRKPNVVFVDDISHDLSRRDFTINAIAMRDDGSLIDPYCGQADLRARTIKTVNKPFDRYNEDPLRMLRAARFASQLDFDVEEQTELQAAKKAHRILEISKERWTQELDKILTSEHPARGLDFLSRTRLINFIMPEMAIQIGFDQDSPYHELGLWQHTLKTVSLAPNDIDIRWAAFFHDIGKPYVRTKNKRGYSNYVHHERVGAEMVGRMGRYLKWPSKRIDEVSRLVLCHLDPESPIQEADAEATHS